ncbi:Alpha/Beta hydrolase protein, partial [Mycena leptocephala]
AGGFSVHAQIVAYGGRDDKLFSRAIVESGTLGSSYGLPADAFHQSIYDSLLTNTACASTANSSESVQLGCIRALPIDELRQATPGLGAVGTMGPLFDGDFLNVSGALAAYREGNWVKVAFLVGSNTDEGRTFAPGGANTDADVEAQISFVVPPDQIDGVLKLYPNVAGEGCPFNTGDFQLDPVQNGVFAPPGTQDKRAAAILGDVGMIAGPRWLAQEVSAQVPLWKYRFNHIPYDVSFGIEDYIGHFVEVPYVFNTQNTDTDFWVTNHFTATYLGPGAPIEDRFLGVYMSRAWTSFAATGDPNNANVSVIHWPRYSQSGQNMVLQTQGFSLEVDNVFFGVGIQYLEDVNVVCHWSHAMDAEKMSV